MKKIKKELPMDRILCSLLILLLVLGMVILYSTSAYNGRVKFKDPAYYLKKQIFASVLGLIVMFLVANTDYHKIAALGVPLYIAALILSTAVLFVGREINGSKRWLSIGPLSFQPSEFAKMAVIIFITDFVCRYKKRTDHPVFMIKVFLLLLPIIGLVGSNNLSTAVIILGIGGIMVFISNPRYLPFLGAGAAGVVFVSIFLGMESYRMERLAIWKNPEAYEKGFQTIQGLYAIGSGGLFGKGLGSSLQKLGFVPEAQNDMIFSIICEETGLVGASLILLLFGLILYRLFINSIHAKDLLGTLICAGIMGHLSIQVILNVAVVTNTIPNTGITLPFISYGGTSILFLMAEMGIALSVSRTCHY